MDMALILPSNAQEELELFLQAQFLGVYLNGISTDFNDEQTN